MKHHKANVIVYVKQSVRKAQSIKISESISALNGVINTFVSDNKKSFICVDYDPQITDSQHILQCVNNKGYPARLIGM